MSSAWMFREGVTSKNSSAAGEWVGARILERLDASMRGTRLESDLKFTRAAGNGPPLWLYTRSEFNGFLTALVRLCSDLESLSPEVTNTDEYLPVRLVWVRELVAHAYEDPRVGGRPPSLPSSDPGIEGKVPVFVMGVKALPDARGCTVHLRVGEWIWFLYAEIGHCAGGEVLSSSVAWGRFAHEDPELLEGLTREVQTALTKGQSYVPALAGFKWPRW